MSKLIIGCGYLGLRVAARWHKEGERVLVTTRSVQRAAFLAGLGYAPVVCDVLEPASLTGLPAVDTVVHCVGFDRRAGRSMHEVYVEGLSHVLRALPGAPRLVYISSTGVYGQSAGEEVDESAVTAPVEESGQVVLEAEQLLRRHRPDAIVLRFAGIYGPGRLLRASALQAGAELATDPEGWLNLIHVEDGATAVLAAEHLAPDGAVINICDDQPVRRREFYTLLAQLLHAASPRFSSPPILERTNRRIGNARLHRDLGMELRYPSYVDGLPASVDPGEPRTK